jgi:phage shock protein C
MTDTSRNTFMRPDTFFGICEALGQDFGFNPLWLRLAFVPGLFFFPFQAPFAYFGLGLMVLASRMLFPARSAAPVAEGTAPAPVAVEAVRSAPAAAEQSEMLPLAA